MTTNDTANLTIGEPSDSGYSLEIVRGYNNGSETFTRKYVIITCHGVKDVDIQDPYDMGTEKNSQIGVKFSAGDTEYIEGVITEIFNTGANDE